MKNLYVALALALAFEGALYALFPEAMQRMMALALSMTSDALRIAGLMAAVVGVFLVWLLLG